MERSRSRTGRPASPMALSGSASQSPQRHKGLARSASTPTLKSRSGLAQAGGLIQRPAPPRLKSPAKARDMSPQGRAMQKMQKSRSQTTLEGIHALNAGTLPTTLRGRHMLLADSLVENVPRKFLKDLVLDPDFAFREDVVDAISRRRIQDTSKSSLKPYGGGLRNPFASPKSNKHARKAGAGTFEDASDQESSRELDSGAVADGPHYAVEVNDEVRKNYDGCTKIGSLYRQGAITLLKGTWLVGFAESIRLEITVVSAKNLKNLDFGSDMDKSDPYCLVHVPAKPQSKWRSKTIWDNLDPVWNQKFEMNTYAAGDSLEFIVYDDDGGDERDSELGRILLRCEAFIPNGYEGELQIGDKGKHGVSYLTIKIELPRNAVNKLPRRQDLPEEATWDVDEIFDGTRLRSGFEIVAVSHTWLSPKHPDPEGTHLQRLGRFLKAWVAIQSGLLLTRVAIFFDWASLPQDPRSKDEQVWYELALQFVGIWFANHAVNVFMMTNTNFHTRGWCSFESALAGLSLYRGGRVYDLGCLDNSSVLPTDALDPKLISTCIPPRMPFLAPKTFELQMQSKKLSVESDYDVILHAYSEAFRAVASNEYFRSLDLSGLTWSDTEIAAIADALPFFTCLQTLNLHDNLIADDGASTLGDIAPLCKLLHTLILTDNEIEEGLYGVDKLQANWVAAGRARRGLKLDFTVERDAELEKKAQTELAYA